MEATNTVTYDTYLKALSFGRNGADDLNTCTAIAVGLALNCFAYAVDEAALADDMKSEKLKGVRWHAADYPNTVRLQRHLVDECGLSPRYHFRRFTLGVWGRKVGRALKRHCAASSPAKDMRMRMRVGPGLGRRIRASIDRDRPALVTTAWSRFEGGRFNTHTMLVYGYRRNAQGAGEYLVHPGWYGADWIDAQTCCVKEVWIPARNALLGYWFA